MTSSSSTVRPPRAAAWLVELFTSTQEADGVLGDLAEEFTARGACDGDKEARRHYRRQAWRTIRDLAMSPLRGRSSSSAAITASGLMLTVGIGLAGLIMTWTVSSTVNTVASVIVTHYPVYYYIPASAFWGGVSLLGPLMTGVLVAFIARGVRFRPMSAALAMVAVMAVMFAVDRPIIMWLRPASITLDSAVVHWVRGVLMSGGPILVGAAIGRLVVVRDNSAQLRPAAE